MINLAGDTVCVLRIFPEDVRGYCYDLQLGAVRIGSNFNYLPALDYEFVDDMDQDWVRPIQVSQWLSDGFGFAAYCLEVLSDCLHRVGREVVDLMIIRLSGATGSRSYLVHKVLSEWVACARSEGLYVKRLVVEPSDDCAFSVSRDTRRDLSIGDVDRQARSSDTAAHWFKGTSGFNGVTGLNDSCDQVYSEHLELVASIKELITSDTWIRLFVPEQNQARA